VQVWERCSHILCRGEVQPITKEWAQRFNAAYERLGSLGERVLGFAYRCVGFSHGQCEGATSTLICRGSIHFA
jgi:hypothetical protein